MYYKIENKESEVYKKLHKMRTNELKIAEENKEAIKEKIGLDFETFLGEVGQQNFARTTQYFGFKFKESEKVDLKIWKKHKEYNEIFIPNKKTKKGKEISEFLSNGLKKSSFLIPIEILELSINNNFVFPYVEIFGELILLYLDDSLKPKDENIIEITSREFDEIQKNN